jgi:hypothetical protein
MPKTLPALPEPAWRRIARSWNAFWFTPRDPTLLGAIRICCGAVTFYTLLMYSFEMDNFLGPNAWIDRKIITEMVKERPMQVTTLSGNPLNVLRPPSTPEEQAYGEEYRRKYGEWPLPPYPKNKREADYCDWYRDMWKFDLRLFGLPPPENQKQWEDLQAYTERYKQAMPPPYPRDDAEVAAIDRYFKLFHGDPRLLYAQGMPTFSIWIHLTDPVAMWVVHVLFMTVTLLFTLGMCTRVTALLTWFAVLNYIHRSWVLQFGVDTMISILLLYLAIGPSGAALSLDRLFARWWKGRRNGGGLATLPPPQPSVSANVAIRLIQVHLCFIYAAAGLSKLLGPGWWSGTALWGVLGNFEFAPMNWQLYNYLLRLLGRNQLVFEIFMTGGAYFTLVFEIMYSVWIWRPATRPLMLAAAALLHGVIGLFMGLGTFALIMLVMNMAFLELREVLALFGIEAAPTTTAPPPAAPRASNQPAALAPPHELGSTHVTARN